MEPTYRVTICTRGPHDSRDAASGTAAGLFHSRVIAHGVARLVEEHGTAGRYAPRFAAAKGHRVVGGHPAAVAAI